jgi:glycosyltransferase involved in cell wall biosynthesis
MPEDLEFVAFVTSKFSQEMRSEFPGFRFVDVGTRRSLLSRLREGSGYFWKDLLAENDCGLWVTDTLPVPRGLDVRTCLTVHDLRFLESRKYVSTGRYMLLRGFMGRSLGRADSVVAVSRWTSDQIMEHYSVPSDKVSVIRNGIDTDALNDSSMVDISVEPPFILSVGHLEARKNFEVLIRALPVLISSWDGKLVIVGKDQGSQASIIRTARESGVHKRMILKSDVSHGELAGLYRSCEVVVCPSRYEGFGITLLEGMAAGTPVVASRIPPHVEVAGDAALYADPDEPEQFTEEILKVIQSNDLSEDLIRRGRERVADYSWDQPARELASLYRKLLSLEQ